MAKKMKQKKKHSERGSGGKL